MAGQDREQECSVDASCCLMSDEEGLMRVWSWQVSNYVIVAMYHIQCQNIHK